MPEDITNARNCFFKKLSAALFLDLISKNEALVLAQLLNQKNRFCQTNLSALCLELSEKTNVSEPTCRRLLQFLRELDLISCGSAGCKGKKVKLTRFGEEFFHELGKIKEKENKV